MREVLGRRAVEGAWQQVERVRGSEGAGCAAARVYTHLIPYALCVYMCRPHGSMHSATTDKINRTYPQPDSELVPVFLLPSAPLLRPPGIDFAGARLCFDFRDLASGSFLAGSLDGQILGGNFVRSSAGDNPEYSRWGPGGRKGGRCGTYGSFLAGSPCGPPWPDPGGQVCAYLGRG